MSSENKVDLVIIDVPSNLLVLHIFKPLSFILPWNRQVDNFIESTMCFVDGFMSDRGVVTTMHVDDSQVLKEIDSFMESYQLKVRMKWVVINSSPKMNSKDPSSQVPQISHFTYVFLL